MHILPFSLKRWYELNVEKAVCNFFVCVRELFRFPDFPQTCECTFVMLASADLGSKLFTGSLIYSFLEIRSLGLILLPQLSLVRIPVSAAVCMVREASMKGAFRLQLLCTFGIKNSEVARFSMGLKSTLFFLVPYSTFYFRSELEGVGSVDSQIYLNWNTIKNHFMMRKY